MSPLLSRIFSAFFLSPVGKYVLGVETEKQGKFNDQGWQVLPHGLPGPPSCPPPPALPQ